MTDNISPFSQNSARFSFSQLPRWVIALIILALVGVVGTLVIRLVTPQTTVVPEASFITQNHDGSTTDFSQITFTGVPLEPITTLPVVEVLPNPLSLGTIRDDFFDTYQLKSIAGADNVWSGPKYSFYYNERQDTYSLNVNFDPPSNTFVNDLPAAITVAQEFIATTFPGLEVTPQTDSILYLQGTRHVEEIKDPTKANFVLIPFNYTIEGIPVFLEHKTTEAFAVTINAQNEIQKVVFQPDFVSLQSIQTAEVIPLDQALININNNQASLVSAYERSTGIFSLEEIVSGELTEVSLEYRLDLENEIGYPFYKFKGSLVNSESKAIEAEVITPAVPVE